MHRKRRSAGGFTRRATDLLSYLRPGRTAAQGTGELELRISCRITRGLLSPRPGTDEDGPAGAVPCALNLTIMAWHAGAAVSMTIECPHGMADGKVQFDYPEILEIHHVLFETVADYLLGAS